MAACDGMRVAVAGCVVEVVVGCTVGVAVGNSVGVLVDAGIAGVAVAGEATATGWTCDGVPGPRDGESEPPRPNPGPTPSSQPTASRAPPSATSPAMSGPRPVRLDAVVPYVPGMDGGGTVQMVAFSVPHLQDRWVR